VPSGAAGRAGGLTAHQRERREVRQILAGAGFDEAWTTTFLAPGDLERAGLDPRAVEVENPLDRSESILRTSLLPGLLKAVKFNRDRQAGDVFLFEIGRVFNLPSADQVTPAESEHIGVVIAPGSTPHPSADGAAAMSAASTWRTLAEALRLEHVALVGGTVSGWHPARAARLVTASGTQLGAVGEVDPDVVTAYGISGRVGFLAVSLDAISEQPRTARQARAVSRFPAGDIDLAFVVPSDTPASDVQATLEESGGELIEDVWLFDVFRSAQIGDASKSLAFRLRFRAPDRTLDETELAELRNVAIEAVTSNFEADLRA
jgi:phenylalanyl-tRNA synthetase beta chain